MESTINRKEDFIIEGGILKAYLGSDLRVNVPEGSTKIGGIIPNDAYPLSKRMIGDPIGYRAFYANTDVREVWLPDSVDTIGFKSFEYCSSLKKLSFSRNTKSFERNCFLGCSFDTITYRGSLYEFTQLDFKGTGLQNIDTVICKSRTEDGSILTEVIDFRNEYYIETLNYPGTRHQWENTPHDPWLDKRVRRVVCCDER